MNSYVRTFWQLRLAEILFLTLSRTLLSIVIFIHLQHELFTQLAISIATYYLTKILAGLLLSGLDKHFERECCLISLSVVMIAAIGCFASYMYGYSYSWLILCLILTVLVDTLFTPLVLAIIPELIPHGNLSLVFRKFLILESFFAVTGICLGLYGIDSLQPQTIILALTVSTLSVLLLCLFLPQLGKNMSTASQNIITINSQVYKSFFQYKFEYYWALIAALLNMIVAPIALFLMPYFVVNVNLLSPVYIGLVEGFGLLGVITASFLPLANQQKRVKILWFSTILMTATTLYLFINQSLYSWFIAAFLTAYAICNINVTINPVRALAIPITIRSELHAIHNLIQNIGVTVGIVLAVFITQLNLPNYWFIAGALLMLGSMSVLLLKITHQNLLNMPETQLDGAYAILYRSSPEE